MGDFSDIKIVSGQNDLRYLWRRWTDVTDQQPLAVQELEEKIVVF